MRPSLEPHDTSGSPWSTAAITNDVEVESVGLAHESYGEHQSLGKRSAKETMSFLKSPSKCPFFHTRQINSQVPLSNIAVEHCFEKDQTSELYTRRELPMLDSYYSKNCCKNECKVTANYESGLKTLGPFTHSTNEEEQIGSQALASSQHQNSSSFSTMYPPRMHYFHPNYSNPKGLNQFDKNTNGVEMDDVDEIIHVDDMILMDSSELIIPKNPENSNNIPILSQDNNDSLSPLCYGKHLLQVSERKWHPRALFETNPYPIPSFNSSNDEGVASFPTPLLQSDTHLCPVDHSISRPILDDKGKIEALSIIDDGLVVENSRHGDRTMNVPDLDIFRHVTP
mmetsp:Transcript_14802/g.20606  ORF Transcript_14802/g.20606 Transcript_14802/m.20606 type:complete len:340 (+) Transcript_14802:416-1435(+)